MSCFVLETRDLQPAFSNPYQTQNSIEHALSEESLLPPIQSRQSICPEPTGPSGPNCHSLGPSRSSLINKCPRPNISKLITCKGRAPSSRHTTRSYQLVCWGPIRPAHRGLTSWCCYTQEACYIHRQTHPNANMGYSQHKTVRLTQYVKTHIGVC